MTTKDQNQNIINHLNSIKHLSSTVDIDKVIEMINQLETKSIGLTVEMAQDISNEFERSLECFGDELFDPNSAEFELSYDNRIELSRIDIDGEKLMELVGRVLDGFTINGKEDEPIQNPYQPE